MPPKQTVTVTAVAAAARLRQRQAENNKLDRTRKRRDERMAIEQFAEPVHLIEGCADTLEAIPPSLTRSLSDLRELDAVLSEPLKQLTQALEQLTQSLRNPQTLTPQQRLELLRTITQDIQRYKLGAQDKIRVANGTCESVSRKTEKQKKRNIHTNTPTLSLQLSHHIRQLDTTTSLLISSLPASLETQIPPSTFPTGYPQLSGSLRSKPIGGVWQNSNPTHLQSPPSREFINYHQELPIRQVYHNHSNRQFDPQPPLTKRPRLGHHHDDDSALLRRDQAEIGGSSSSRALDQHIYSQSVHHDDKHRNTTLDDHHPSEPRNSNLATKNPLARQHSQLGVPASPNPPASKGKRARIPSALVHPEPEDYSASKPSPTPQQPVGPKKRVRKR
jgi:hypothetical protein